MFYTHHKLWFYIFILRIYFVLTEIPETKFQVLLLQLKFVVLHTYLLFECVNDLPKCLQDSKCNYSLNINWPLWNQRRLVNNLGIGCAVKLNHDVSDSGSGYKLKIL